MKKYHFMVSSVDNRQKSLRPLKEGGENQYGWRPRDGSKSAQISES